MKVKKVLISLLLLLLTGCVKSNITMTVNSDKSMILTGYYLVSDSVKNTKEFLDYKLDVSSMIKRGFDIKTYSEEGYIGNKITKTYPNIDNVSAATPVEVKLSDFGKSSFSDIQLFTVKKGLLKNKYTAIFKYDLTKSASAAESVVTPSVTNSGNDIESLIKEEKVDIKYSITLPSKSLSNNATSVSEDATTLNWILTEGKINDINYEFELYNKSNIIILAFSLIAIVFVVYVVIKLKSVSKNKSPEQPEEVNINTNIDENKQETQLNSLSKSIEEPIVIIDDEVDNTPEVVVCNEEQVIIVEDDNEGTSQESIVEIPTEEVIEIEEEPVIEIKDEN